MKTFNDPARMAALIAQLQEQQRRAFMAAATTPRPVPPLATSFLELMRPGIEQAARSTQAWMRVPDFSPLQFDSRLPGSEPKGEQNEKPDPF